MTEPLETAPSSAPTQRSWLRRTRRALGFGVSDADTIVVALAGFLVRGGIVLVLLPSAVLPSVIGIASITGVAAFGIDGRPTAWLIEVIVIISALAALWLVMAFILGSLVDVWLVDATLEDGGHATRRPRSLPPLGILLDLAGIRALCSLPLVGSLIWAGSRIYASAYNELTTPSNVTTPLPLRVIEGAADAVLVVGLAWLVGEVVGAIAVRRSILLGTGVWRSIGGAIEQIVRRPISSAATVIVSFGTSAAATGLAIAATAGAFDWCRIAARDQQAILVTIGVSPFSTTRDFRPVVFLLASIALAVAWFAALAISGIASAWRSSSFTIETADTLASAQPQTDSAILGLSGPSGER